MVRMRMAASVQAGSAPSNRQNWRGPVCCCRLCVFISCIPYLLLALLFVAVSYQGISYYRYHRWPHVSAYSSNMVIFFFVYKVEVHCCLHKVDS